MDKNEESKRLIKSSLENLGIARQLKNVKTIFNSHKNKVNDEDYSTILEDAISKINSLNSDIEKLTKGDK